MKLKNAVICGLFFVLSCMLLAACGGSGSKADLSNSKYLGTWKAVSMTLKDESAEMENEIILVLNADGTAKLTDGEEVTNCTWEETKDGFKTKGDAKMTFKEDDKGIYYSLMGVEMHFEKQ